MGVMITTVSGSAGYRFRVRGSGLAVRRGSASTGGPGDRQVVRPARSGDLAGRTSGGVA
jgi:hypothetical protein